MSFLSYLWDIIRAFIAYFQYIKIDDPQNHIILITGCDSGFGLMSVHRLLQQGYFVVALCLTEKGVSELHEYAKTNGFENRCVILQCDVTKGEDVKKVYEKVEGLLKSNESLKLWALVNNAGIAISGFADWLSMEGYHKTFDVNFFAVVNLTKVFLQQLKRVKNSRIINICSLAGISGSPNFSAYSASKHALEGFAKCLRLELMTWNIHVTNINPGYMRTPIIGKGLNSVRTEYEKAPKEIRDQYPVESLAIGEEKVRELEEDPSLVVDCILENITRASPTLNNYPGKYAKRFIWSLWLTPTIVKQVLGIVGMKYSGFGPYPEVLKKLQK